MHEPGEENAYKHTIAFVIRINHKKTDMKKKRNTKRKRDSNGKLYRNSSGRNVC